MTNSTKQQNSNNEPNRARMSTRTTSSSVQTSHTGGVINNAQTNHTSSNTQTSHTGYNAQTSHTGSINNSSTLTQTSPIVSSSSFGRGPLPPGTSVPGRSILKPSSSSTHVYSSNNSQPLNPKSSGTHSNTVLHNIPTTISQYTSSIPSQYPFSIPQYIPMNPMGYPPAPTGVPFNIPPPNVQSSQVVQPMILQQQQMEYQAAMELEMWKMTQEQTFKKEMRYTHTLQH